MKYASLYPRYTKDRKRIRVYCEVGEWIKSENKKRITKQFPLYDIYSQNYLARKVKGKYVYPDGAIRILKDLREQIKLENINLTYPSQRFEVTLRDILSMYFSQKQIASGTQTLYKYAVGKFIEAVSNKYVTAISKNDFFHFQSFLLSNLKHNSAKIIIDKIYSLLNFAVENEILDKHPFPKKQRMKEQINSPLFFSQNEIEQIFEYFKNNTDIYYFKFLLLTGFRRQEAVNLKWSDINYELNFIRVFNSKKNKEEFFPLYESLKTLLNEIPKNKSEYVFKQISNYYYLEFKKCISDLKLNTKYNLHTFRKTLATNLVTSGVNDFLVAKILRNTQPIAVNHYIGEQFNNLLNILNSQSKK